jgi:hypothetical protein
MPPGGIRTQNPSRRAALGPRLIPLGKSACIIKLNYVYNVFIPVFNAFLILQNFVAYTFFPSETVLIM